MLARYARNTRLADALQQWAMSSLRGSPGARAYYDALRARKISHQAALRRLANRNVGILHGCFKTRSLYDENTAWGHQTPLRLDIQNPGMSAAQRPNRIWPPRGPTGFAVAGHVNDCRIHHKLVEQAGGGSGVLR